MKIVVCVKYIQGELNPFDACALECALQQENAEITVVSMGPISVAEKIRQLTRYEVKDVILLSDSRFAGSDTLATAYVLSLAMKRLQPDLILCGRQSIDGDTAQVGPCLAAMLSYELHTNVMEWEKDHCVTRMGEEKIELPALLTIERINQLRFFSIRSKEREIAVWSAGDLGAEPQRCGGAGSPTVVVKSFENTRGQRRCQWIAPTELIPLTERLCREEAAMRTEQNDSGEKMDVVHVVGQEMREAGERIGRQVVVAEERSPEAIAREVQNARVVLWPADLWGRRTAPQTAAILQTGLCADCTDLQVENGELYMIRPARGGNITAKIRCKTKPKMATVRMSRQVGQIMVSGGRGIAECRSLLERLTGLVKGESGASRALVDMGLAPYEWQVGLTGKSVSPKIYIAVGISGAVHHTCAIEGAGTVIAVNPDPKARIFSYADYGIRATLEELMACLEPADQ